MQAAICNDTIKNGTETDVDCGGAGARAAMTSRAASSPTTARAASAAAAACSGAVPGPTDSVKNGTETDIDCGGGAAGTPKCATDKTCALHADCTSDGCAYTGKCAVARSCTAKYGGDTCGAGGAGGRGAAVWESCCATAPAGVGGIAMDKYKVTSGRMRAFLERTKGDVRKFMGEARVAGELHGAPWNAAWEAYLPTAMDGCEQTGTCGAAELSDHNYDEPGEPVNASFVGIYSSAYRHLGGMMFDGQQLGQQGCTVGAPGTHSYWMDAATQTKYFGDVPPDYAQADYDPKPLNCVNYLMAEAFCVWDGGRLETQAEYLAAGGAVNSGGAVNGPVPWGAPKPQPQSSSTYYAFRYPTSTDAMLIALNLPPSDPNYKYVPKAGYSIEWASYLYSYEYPNLKATDYIVHLNAPGRLLARSPNGHADLVGPLMEMTSDVTMNANPKLASARWSANGSFEGHQWGYYGWNFSLLNKYGKQGLRCVYP